MAAIGDSLTQATNSDLLHIGASNPAQSWSTGDDQGDVVVSHYERLLARNGAIAGRNLNVSVPGARMGDGPAQASRAAAHGAEYVTVLMGTNDVCASSNETMTPVATYEAAFRETMATLTAALPAARIFVVSVPDVYQLWSLNRFNLVAQLSWQYFRICQSMFAWSNTEADRQAVRARNAGFNDVLRQVCGESTRCRYDDDRLVNQPFTAADIGVVDHFHLSTIGQRTLAEVTWRQGDWP